MRINSSIPTYHHINQRNNLMNNNNELFKSALLEQTTGKNDNEDKENKSEEKKGKLVTTKEGPYVRQYLVHSDGSKVLLSEIKQAEVEDEATPTENYSRLLTKPSNHHDQADAMSENTEDIISFLNQLVGNITPEDKKRTT